MVRVGGGGDMFFFVIKCSVCLLTTCALVLIISLKTIRHYGVASYEVTSLGPAIMNGKDFMSSIREGSNLNNGLQEAVPISCRYSGDCISTLTHSLCVNGTCECMQGFTKEVYDSVTQCRCPKGSTRFGNYCLRIAEHDKPPTYADAAMESRRNSTAVFGGHDDFKEYLSPPEYTSGSGSSCSSSSSSSSASQSEPSTERENTQDDNQSDA
ncbi:unnamed protein product [Notodromas monacha]|uniref:EB domain-containing protein n=1 Tax=Notodromas monacha TaxID=399045 RepID=A0A7R9BRV3_9CRUS|nr:unnamed protein product [Notodromas monacha]CAG0919159.1 unnamed protein product [Notodromas monacha]